MANEKIYVVTQGTYSDYHIVAATTDREIAEKIAAKFSDQYDECDVEEYDDAEVMLRPAWVVNFNQNGSVINTYECTSAYDYADVGRCREYQWGSCRLSVVVSTNDRESAIKIAAEKRAQYLAEKMGL